MSISLDQAYQIFMADRETSCACLLYTSDAADE